MAEGEKQGSLVRSVSKSRRVWREELLLSGIPSILVTQGREQGRQNRRDTQDQFRVPLGPTHTRDTSLDDDSMLMRVLGLF